VTDRRTELAWHIRAIVYMLSRVKITCCMGLLKRQTASVYCSLVYPTEFLCRRDADFIRLLRSSRQLVLGPLIMLSSTCSDLSDARHCSGAGAGWWRGGDWTSWSPITPTPDLLHPRDSCWSDKFHSESVSRRHPMRQLRFQTPFWRRISTHCLLAFDIRVVPDSAISNPARAGHVRI